MIDRWRHGRHKKEDIVSCGERTRSPFQRMNGGSCERGIWDGACCRGRYARWCGVLVGASLADWVEASGMQRRVLIRTIEMRF